MGWGVSVHGKVPKKWSVLHACGAASIVEPTSTTCVETIADEYANEYKIYYYCLKSCSGMIDPTPGWGRD